MSKKVTRGSKISMHLWFIGMILAINIFIFDFDLNTIKDIVLEIEEVRSVNVFVMPPDKLSMEEWERKAMEYAGKERE